MFYISSYCTWNGVQIVILRDQSCPKKAYTLAKPLISEKT
jgi:hypothetical protein